jgi:hypothetical protein
MEQESMNEPSATPYSGLRANFHNHATIHFITTSREFDAKRHSDLPTIKAEQKARTKGRSEKNRLRVFIGRTHEIWTIDRLLHSQWQGVPVILHAPFSSVLWHVDPLLGNDREINNYTTDIAK